jgi:anti-sigma factor RsiW
LTCPLYRRQIGAYLDGALAGSPARRVGAHLQRCLACRGEAESLRRLQALLRRTVSIPAEPDWTGFWQGIVRGIQDARRVPVALPRALPRVWWRPRLAVGAAMVAAVVLSVTLWQSSVWTPLAPDFPVIVSSADTEYPGGTMVYSTADRAVTVVWVFDDD